MSPYLRRKKRSRLQPNRKILSETSTKVAQSLRVFQVIVDAHFRAIIRARRNFLRADPTQLPIGRMAISFTGKGRHQPSMDCQTDGLLYRKRQRSIASLFFIDGLGDTQLRLAAMAPGRP